MPRHWPRTWPGMQLGGLELPRTKVHYVLSVTRLPFRHSCPEWPKGPIGTGHGCDQALATYVARNSGSTSWIRTSADNRQRIYNPTPLATQSSCYIYALLLLDFFTKCAIFRLGPESIHSGGARAILARFCCCCCQNSGIHSGFSPAESRSGAVADHRISVLYKIAVLILEIIGLRSRQSARFCCALLLLL